MEHTRDKGHRKGQGQNGRLGVVYTGVGFSSKHALYYIFSSLYFFILKSKTQNRPDRDAQHYTRGRSFSGVRRSQSWDFATLAVMHAPLCASRSDQHEVDHEDHDMKPMPPCCAVPWGACRGKLRCGRGKLRCGRGKLRCKSEPWSRHTLALSRQETALLLRCTMQHCCYDALCSTGATMQCALALLCSGTQGTERCLPVVLRLMLRLLIVRAQQQPLDPVQRRVVVVLRT